MNGIEKIFRKIFHKNDTIPSIRGEFNIVQQETRKDKEFKDWSLTHGRFDEIPFSGKGQKVAVIDTGCDLNHEEFDGRVSGKTFLNNETVMDHNGHGTFCMGQILASKNSKGVLGVAPKAKGISYKVFRGSSSSDHNEFVNALEKSIIDATDSGCGVINMSLGMGKDSRIELALQTAVDKGVIPVAAAGNDGMKGSLWKSYPASFENCISVSSANSKDMPAWFSSFGRPGSRWEQPEVAIASLEYYWGCVPGGYGKMIGSSMAAPIVAGMALLWREAMVSKGILPEGANVLKEYRDWLQKVANDTNKNGWDAELGYGVLIIENGEI